MAKKRFALDARVDTDGPEAVERVLLTAFRDLTVLRGENPGEFVLRGEALGENAKELNRELLTALRRAEKKTRLRAEWKAGDGTVSRFFDYVLKKTWKA